MPERFVLDSFAVLALLQGEPGAVRVRDLLDQAQRSEPLHLTVVNLGEVLYNMEMRRGRGAALEAVGLIDALPIQLAPVDRNLALRAARLKATVRLGYADCFVAALAETLGAKVLTGDPDFAAIESQIAIEWLPRRPI